LTALLNPTTIGSPRFVCITLLTSTTPPSPIPRGPGPDARFDISWKTRDVLPTPSFSLDQPIPRTTRTTGIPLRVEGRLFGSIRSFAFCRRRCSRHLSVVLFETIGRGGSWRRTIEGRTRWTEVDGSGLKWTAYQFGTRTRHNLRGAPGYTSFLCTCSQ
jgi:hypothetical protein